MPNTTAPGPATTLTGTELPFVALPQKRLLTINESDIPLIEDTVAPNLRIPAKAVDARSDNCNRYPRRRIRSAATAKTAPFAATSAWSQRCRSTHRDRG